MAPLINVVFFEKKNTVRAKQSFGRASHSWFLAKGTGLGNETGLLLCVGVGTKPHAQIVIA